MFQVKDEPLLSRARQTLPKDLEIARMADDSAAVIAKRDFCQGTTFGPLQARRDRAMNPMTSFPIKVFGSGAADTYHLDYSDEETSNWMCFVAAATCAQEQNLICYQVESDIFYTAMRTIAAGEELRVWYAPRYALDMKMPLYNVEFANVAATFAIDQVEKSPTDREDDKNDQADILSKRSDRLWRLLIRQRDRELGRHLFVWLQATIYGRLPNACQPSTWELPRIRRTGTAEYAR